MYGDSDLLKSKNSAELMGQLCKLQRRFHRRSSKCTAQPQEGRLETGQQDAILPHSGSYSFHIGTEMPDDFRRSETTLTIEASSTGRYRANGHPKTETDP